MNNILRDEIELTDAELAEIYGAVGGDDDDSDDDTDQTPVDDATHPGVQALTQAPPKQVFCEGGEREKKPCVDIFIICDKCR
jgi:hypothetical protein